MVVILFQFCTKPRTRIIGVHTKPDPETITEDYIGPPDPESNIRPILRHIPENETKLQMKFRLKRVDVHEWNQQFWKNHNERFYTVRKIFKIG